MAATTALVVAAAASAYSAKKQADASNKAAKAANTPQEFTRTSDPYMSGALAPHLQSILQAQADLFNGRQSTEQSGSSSVTSMGKPKQPASTSLPAKGGSKSATGNKASAALPATPTVAQPAGGLSTANGVLSQVAKQGLAAGNSPLVKDAANFTSGTLNASNFSGRNDILDNLNSKLSGSDFNRSTDLLLKFLGANGGGGTPQAGASGKTSSVTLRGADATRGLGYSPGSAAGPSSSLSGNGTFAKEAQGFFDAAKRNPADDPNVAALVASLKGDALEAHSRSVADLDARMEAAGRFGGGTWSDTRSLANQEFDRGLDGQISGLYVNERQSALDRALSTLGLLNTREIASMNDATQRAGISASSSASAAGLNAQTELARRGQDLDAINSLLKHDEFGLSTMGSLGSQLSDDQFKALASVPGLEGINLTGLGIAGGAGGSMAGLESSLASSAASRAAASASANVERSRLNFDQQRYQDALPQVQIDNYLRTLGLIGGMGGTQSGVNPGASLPYVNSNAAAIMGGAGGAMTLYGLQQGTR